MDNDKQKQHTHAYEKKNYGGHLVKSETADLMVISIAHIQVAYR